MTETLSKPQKELLAEFERDLDVCIRSEMLERWSGSSQRAIESILNRNLGEAVPADHNPLWRIALRYWFDNDPSLLWEPLHKNWCIEFTNFYLSPRSTWTSFMRLMQRESYKSTFSHGAEPMWVALRERHLKGKDTRLALLHHREQQASANLQRLRSKTVQHEGFKRVWPEYAASEDYGTKTEFDWKCRTNKRMSEPSVIAMGLGTRGTGLHFDFMWYSDPVTEEHINSKLIREEALLRYQASQFMLDTLVGKEAIDGTRYHLHDLHAKNLKTNAKRLVVGAGGFDPTTGKVDLENFPLTMPNRHTLAFLEERRQTEITRSGNDFLWWLQYQNQAKASNMLVAEWEWFQSCTVNDIPPSAWYVILVDPAWKGTKNAGEGDDAAIEVWALAQVGSLVLAYFVDGTYSNLMTGEDGKAEIFRFMKRYGIIDVAPEERGGYAFKTSLQNDASSRGLVINVIDLESSGQSKIHQRIPTFLAKAQRREVFICDSVPPSVLAKFKEQVEDHPQNEHEDLLDCGAYICDPAIAAAYVPRHGRGNFRSRFAPKPREDESKLTRHCAL